MIVDIKFTDEKFYIPVNMPAMQLFFSPFSFLVNECWIIMYVFNSHHLVLAKYLVRSEKRQEEKI